MGTLARWGEADRSVQHICCEVRCFRGAKGDDGVGKTRFSEATMAREATIFASA